MNASILEWKIEENFIWPWHCPWLIAELHFLKYFLKKTECHTSNQSSYFQKVCPQGTLCTKSEVSMMKDSKVTAHYTNATYMMTLTLTLFWFISQRWSTLKFGGKRCCIVDARDWTDRHTDKKNWPTYFANFILQSTGNVCKFTLCLAAQHSVIWWRKSLWLMILARNHKNLQVKMK
jgi:hypothetical protein